MVVSHSDPVNPSSQTHSYASRRSPQVPKPQYGFELHSSIDISHRRPVQPGWHRHEKYRDVVVPKQSPWMQGADTQAATTEYIKYLHVFKDTGTKACLRERILGGTYFNEGVCDVNHNSLQFSTLYFSVHNHATCSHGSSYWLVLK